MSSTQPAMSTSVPSPFGFAPAGKSHSKNAFCAPCSPTKTAKMILKSR